MDCWSILQLPEDADQRSIKRSYARLLKSTRPDDDAEGFQRLREAYEDALEIARWRDDDEDIAEVSVVAPVTVAEESRHHSPHTEAVQQTEWLTPAQAARQLQEYRQVLLAHLQAAQEREFVNQLKLYSEQSWLKVFDHRQEWQQILLQLLHETRWSLPLFERVCQLFGWDERTGVTPEPAWVWRALIQRCEQEGFYQQLLAKAQNPQPWNASQLAAHLLLMPLTRAQQMALYQRFDAAEWQACEQLAETLAYQYPALLERLPDPDVFFWREFTPRPIAGNSWSWLWAASALALLLHFLPLLARKVLHGESIWVTLMLAGTWALIPVWVGRFLMPRWLTLSSRFIVRDVQLSQRLLPRRINPNGYWLVLRHGVPQAVLALCFWTALGALGLGTFVGVGLIGLFDHSRRGAERPASAWQRPLQSVLHWTRWSPAQLVFFLIMLGITVTCIFSYPGFPLTRPS